MNRRTVLTFNAIFNLVLGAILIFRPAPVIETLGVPPPAFYATILGTVLVGVALASFLGRGRGRSGLGLSGAAVIETSTGLALGAWLLFGNLNLPRQGILTLWLLVIIFIGLGLAALLTSDDPLVP